MLTRARVLADLGAAQRAAGALAEARDALRKALELAMHCGAQRLADQIRDELALAGVAAHRLKPTGAALLTAAERRVADLAAQEISDLEIAQALFLSVRDVEEQSRRRSRSSASGHERRSATR